MKGRSHCINCTIAPFVCGDWSWTIICLGNLSAGQCLNWGPLESKAGKAFVDCSDHCRNDLD